MADFLNPSPALFNVMPDSPLKTAVLMLVVAAVVFTVIKPDFMYDREGNFESFGTGPKQTLMPFWLAITLAGLVGYYLSFAAAE